MKDKDSTSKARSENDNLDEENAVPVTTGSGELSVNPVAYRERLEKLRALADVRTSQV